MRAVAAVLITAALASTGCEPRRDAGGAAPAGLSPATRAAVTDAVRQFAQDVAHDVTREGPAAWRRYFSPGPTFFMASDGQLVFSNAASAARGIDDLTRTLRSIELRWGDDHAGTASRAARADAAAEGAGGLQRRRARREEGRQGTGRRRAGERRRQEGPGRARGPGPLCRGAGEVPGSDRARPPAARGMELPGLHEPQARSLRRGARGVPQGAS